MYREPKTNLERDAMARNVAKLPELAYVDVLTEPVICIVKRGEGGYYRTDWPKGKHGAQIVAERNERLGVSPAQASALSHGSMFGYFTPAADPDHEVNNPAKTPKAAR